VTFSTPLAMIPSVFPAGLPPLGVALTTDEVGPQVMYCADADRFRMR
jgi:hypothetical protein